MLDRLLRRRVELHNWSLMVRLSEPQRHHKDMIYIRFPSSQILKNPHKYPQNDPAQMDEPWTAL